ncbi:MAG: leucyl aminopeptidase [Marinobacterium sp.]|nr:leucyl aminopeptidase [Marinobacterium sp.]
MDFEIFTGSIATATTDCIIAGIAADNQLTPSAEVLNKASKGYISDILNEGDIQGKPGETLLLHRVPGVTAKRVLLLGLGAEKERHDRNHRKVIKAAMDKVKAGRFNSAMFALDDVASHDPDLYRQVRHLTEWAGAELYRYDETKSQKAEPLALTNLSIAVTADQSEVAEFAMQDGVAISNGVSTARELGNLPGNICTPAYLADQALELGREYDSVETSILDEAEMAELGMHCLLSVGNGSEQPSKLIVMHYRGGEANEQPHVLVGKGITFDTGGISLKPGAAMDEMKFDMCGAASVIGTMNAVAEMGLPINVVAVVAAAENMPAGNATKPGDIVTTLSGKTVEILNTDAEGRLVLCDALTYIERFNPATVLDIATLTGACIIALGHQATAVLANDDALAREILEAGEQAADRAWQLPLWDEYQEQLDSNFADIANIGGRPAGTITAACFLSRFTEEYRWAHLDIAGVAWASGGKAKGASGRCVPLLCQYLMNQAAEEE